jgi:hypothetical protein
LQSVSFMAMPLSTGACQRNKHEHRNNCYHNCNFYNGCGPSPSQSNGEFKKRKIEDVTARANLPSADYQPYEPDDHHDDDGDDGNMGVCEQSVAHPFSEIPDGCQTVEVSMTLRLVTSIDITHNEVNSAAAAAAAPFKADVLRRLSVMRSIPTTPETAFGGRTTLAPGTPFGIPSIRTTFVPGTLTSDSRTTRVPGDRFPAQDMIANPAGVPAAQGCVHCQ